MKFDALCAVAHNIADSFGSGASLVFNAWVDVFKEAAQSPNRTIEIDFLKREVIEGAGSQALRDALAKSEAGLSSLCRSHGTTPASFRQLTVRYIADAGGKRYVVTVENDQGKIRSDEYAGSSGGRVRKTSSRLDP